MEMQGEVVSGLGHGREYVGMEAYQDRFEDVLGFSPYPGTLNLLVDTGDRSKLQDASHESHIPAFEVDGNRFSAVDVFPVQLGGVDAALLELAVTDHPDGIAELVAPVNLRDELGLEDGDTVICRPR